MGAYLSDQSVQFSSVPFRRVARHAGGLTHLYSSCTWSHCYSVEYYYRLWHKHFVGSALQTSLPTVMNTATGWTKTGRQASAIVSYSCWNIL